MASNKNIIPPKEEEVVETQDTTQPEEKKEPLKPVPYPQQPPRVIVDLARQI